MYHNNHVTTNHNNHNNNTLEWMIPCLGPDVTSIQRIQSAFPPNTMMNDDRIDILDAIVCQVRLKVERLQVSNELRQHRDVTTLPQQQPPVEALYTNDPIDDDHATNNTTTTTTTHVWTIEALNRYGEPTLPIPQLFPCHCLPHGTLQHSHAQYPPHEWYIVFHTHEHSIPGNRPLAIGIVSSPINESHHIFKIRWVASPMNYPMTLLTTLPFPTALSKRGHVSIHFQYSLGMGCIPPPNKQSLYHGGAIQTCYLVPNVVVPSDPWPGHSNIDDNDDDDLATDTTMRNDCTILNVEPYQIPTLPKRLSSYDTILAYGDSILEQLVASQRCDTSCTSCCGDGNNHQQVTDAVPPSNTYHHHHHHLDSDQSQTQSTTTPPKIHFGPKLASPINCRTVTSIQNEIIHYIESFVRGNKNSSSSSIALLLNGALWDVLSDEATMGTCMADKPGESIERNDEDPWDDHIYALRAYIALIRTRYPTLHIYWVLPTAVHIHRVHLLADPLLLIKAPQKIARTKYMSASRTDQLYQRQTDTIAALNESIGHSLIWCIDIYEATYLSADWTLPGDGRHYRPELNQRLLSLFY